MNDPIGGGWGPRRAVALAVGAAVVALATARSGSSAPSSNSFRAAVPGTPSGLADCLTVSRCYAPRPFLPAYGIQPLHDRGIDGRGQTVVLPELADTAPAAPPRVTDIRQDLTDFEHRFGLPRHTPKSSQPLLDRRPRRG